MLVPYVDHRKPSAEPHNDRGALLGEDNTPSPEQAVLKGSVQGLPVEGMSIPPQRIDDGPNLHRTFEQKVISLGMGADGSREKVVSAGPAPKREELLP